MNQETKDKGIFIVAFLAAAVAFSAFKEELLKVNITIAGTAFDALHISEVFFGLLAASAYFYACDYLRFTFAKYQNFFLFRITSFLANFFYFGAMLFPPVVFLAWVITLLLSSIIPVGTNRAETNHLIIEIVFGAIPTLLSAFISVWTSRIRKKLSVDSLETQRGVFLEKALDLFSKGFYGETVTDIFRTIEVTLKEKLLGDKNLSSKNMSFKELFHLAIENKILSKEQAILLRKVLEIRNLAVHSAEPITQEQAKLAIDLAKSIWGISKE
jgi:hypothetical protein